jgi:hypothetical protein
VALCLVLASCLLAAELPDDAVGAVAAVELRIAAGDTGFEALFAVTVFKFVAEDPGGGLRMKPAIFLVVTHLRPAFTFLLPTA